LRVVEPGAGEAQLFGALHHLPGVCRGGEIDAVFHASTLPMAEPVVNQPPIPRGTLDAPARWSKTVWPFPGEKPPVSTKGAFCADCPSRPPDKLHDLRAIVSLRLGLQPRAPAVLQSAWPQIARVRARVEVDR
jgi:hypothetical protein